MNDIDRVAVITEITNLYHRIAQACDYGTLDEYAQLLADDVCWDLEELPAALLPTQIRRGKPDVLAGARERRAAGIQGPGTLSWHVINNIAITPDPDDSSVAHGAAYFMAWVELGGTPSVRSAGVYRDRFVKTGDGWVLSYRRARRA